jgi:hypothetical protein
MTTRGTVLRAASGAAVLTVLATGGFAGATTHHSATRGRRQAQPSSAVLAGGKTTRYNAVTAVPGSSDAYVIQASGFGAANDRFSVMRYHHGHLQKFWSPKLGGRYGHLDSITALSKKHVLAGAGAQIPHSIDQIVQIFRRKGHKFMQMKLPPRDTGSTGVGSISASALSNIWAVGGIYPQNASNGPQSLHFNGSHWSFVDTPPSVNYDGPYTVSTSSPKNAWTLRGDGNVLYWNGISWTDVGPAPLPGDTAGHIATSSRSLVYVTASDSRSIMKFNGKKWVKTKVKGVPSTATISGLTLVGREAWATAGWRNKKNMEQSAILRTTGGAWKPQYKTRGKGLNYIQGISASSAKHAFALGSHYPDFDTTGHPVLYVLHGHKWKAK